MSIGGPGLISLLRTRGWVAAVVVTSLTIVLVAGVILATTSLGCGPANRVGLKLARCTDTSGKAAALYSPTPVFFPTPSAKGGYPPVATPVTFYPPATNPTTYYPPVNNPTTFYPPNIPPGSSGTSPQDPFYPLMTGATSAGSLSCTLPIYAGPPGSGGFISFPGGNFTADPRSAVAAPSPGPQQGYGYGYGPSGMSYDRSHSRWLPVAPQLVAPDGNHYAYASNDGIYVVDAANGTQVELGQGHPWQLLRVLNDRVYATVPGTPGFWVVPFTGAPSEVTTSGYWQAATANAAYGTATSAVPAGTTQKLLKLNTATGKVSDWFSTPGATVSVLGFDLAGDPVIQAGYVNTWELWLSGRVIANSYEQFFVQGAMFADSHGLWFPIYYQGGNVQGIALYVPGSGLYMVSQLGAQVAGVCA